jgi:hypothetical protein
LVIVATHPTTHRPIRLNIGGERKRLIFLEPMDRSLSRMKDEEPVEDIEDIRNDIWLKENYVGLVDEYPNLWIAVIDQEVVAKGSTKHQVDSEAREIAKGRTYSLYFIEPSALPP